MDLKHCRAPGLYLTSQVLYSEKNEKRNQDMGLKCKMCQTELVSKIYCFCLHFQYQQDVGQGQ